MREKNTSKTWVLIVVAAATFGCLVTAGTAARAAEFSYAGDEGPGFWGDLAPAWENCSTDLRQSPINITKVVHDATLKPLVLALHETAINLNNNGHTIKQKYESGSTLTFEAVVYELQEFHFHTLSEHAIRGERGVMELHAVFKNDATGNRAVIGQLYDLGKENAFLAAFDHMLPTHQNDHNTSPSKINVKDAFKNTTKYYTYPGSLTTPPCDPTVTWIVLKKRATMSEEQFHLFNDILGNNFRPFQDLNGRTIRLSR